MVSSPLRALMGLICAAFLVYIATEPHTPRATMHRPQHPQEITVSDPFADDLFKRIAAPPVIELGSSERETKQHLASMGIRIKPKEEWYLGVCSATKASVAWLREWIELQMISGVDHLWIVNDNDEFTEDGTQKVLEFYQRLGFVTIIAGRMPRSHAGCIKKPGTKVAEHNCAAPKHCAEQVGDQVQWLIFADSDEFIYPHQGCSLSDYVRNTCNPNEAVVKIRWERFGSSGFRYQPSGLMTENFLTSGGDCSDLTSSTYDSFQDACKNTRFGMCSECRHMKMMFNTGRCLTNDHIGWMHFLTNTTEWKEGRGKDWLSQSDGAEGSPFKNKKCFEDVKAKELERCEKWMQSVPTEADGDIEFSNQCCSAGIGYNHYGTKALQYYFRKQKRRNLDLRGWRVSLDAIDLSGVLSFSVLRFVRALRSRFRMMGLPTALDVDFIDVHANEPDAAFNGTCFREVGYKYQANEARGTTQIEVEVPDLTPEDCCLACHKQAGCKGWTLSKRACELLIPSSQTVHGGAPRPWVHLPRQYLPADRVPAPHRTSGLIVRDECFAR